MSRFLRIVSEQTKVLGKWMTYITTAIAQRAPFALL